MGAWMLECPTGGVYKCNGHYEGGHGEPFSLHCDTIKTVKAPKEGGCIDVPERGTGLITGRAGERRKGKPRTEEERSIRHENPRTRRFLPHGLTAEEKASPKLRRKLARCIKKTEVRCCGSPTTDYAKCSCNPVAVCRASVKL